MLPLVSHSTSRCDFPGLTPFHFVFAPAFRQLLLLSVPDRRDFRARTCNLRDRIGDNDTAPFSPYDLSMISGNQGTVAGDEKPTSPSGTLSGKSPLSFPPGTTHPCGHNRGLSIWENALWKPRRAH
jgi:hypothetical protein